MTLIYFVFHILMFIFIVQVNNSHEDCNYCLRHGIEILSKKHNQLKYFKFLYTFDEVSGA